MTSDLSIFAARLREFISISTEEFSLDDQTLAVLAAHTDAEFNGMALVLFALQFAHNPPYWAFCESRNIQPHTVTHWTQIPAVPTAAFKELDLTCLPADQRTNVFHSSGTTEQRPSRHFHSPESLAVYEASLWPWFEHHVAPDRRTGNRDLQLAFLTPPASQVPRSSLVHMFETVRRKLSAPDSAFLGSADNTGAWTLDCDVTAIALRNAEQTNQPVVLMGTAFSFVHLLDWLVERDLRFRLPPGSRVMETGGYKGRSRELPKAELHALITEKLGVPATHIVCEYGMSELSSQAYDGGSPQNVPQAARALQFPPWAKARVISAETGREVADGETGLIQVFDLANVFSVMALQTEDLAIRRGKGFELIGRSSQSEPRGCSLMNAEAPAL